MADQLSRQERRELKKQMRAAKYATLSSRGRLTSMLWWGFFILVLAALIGYVIWNILRPLSGTKVPILERSHVEVGEKPQYNSNPPTSGPHYGQTEEWGISDKPLVMERLVHNLEHGGVNIFYNCEKCEDLAVQLKDLAQRLRKKDRKVVLAPNKDIDAKIAVASWGWYDKMNELDEDRIWRFFEDHINRGPERVF